MAALLRRAVGAVFLGCLLVIAACTTTISGTPTALQPSMERRVGLTELSQELSFHRTLDSDLAFEDWSPGATELLIDVRCEEGHWPAK